MTINQYLVFLFLFIPNVALLAQSPENRKIPVQKHTASNKNKLNTLNVWQFCFGRQLSNKKTDNLPAREKHSVFNSLGWIEKTINREKLQPVGMGNHNFQIPQNKQSGMDRVEWYPYSAAQPHKPPTNNIRINKTERTENNRKGRCPLTLPQLYYFSTNTDNRCTVFPASNFIEASFRGIHHDIHFRKQNVHKQFTFEKMLITSLIMCQFLFVFAGQVVLNMTGISKTSHSIVSSLSVTFFIVLLVNSNPGILFELIPGFNLKYQYQIWVFSLLSVPIILKLLKILFPTEVNPMIETGIYSLFTLCILTIPTLSLEFIVEFGDLFIYTSFVCVGYMYYVLIKAVINQREFVVVQILNLTIVILLIVCNFVSPCQLTWHRNLSFFAAAAYILILSITFFLKLIKLYKLKINRLCKLELADLTSKNMAELRTKEFHTSNAKLLTINREKDFVISTISHDLMNSFNVLINFTRLFSHDDSLPENSQGTMQMLYRAAKNGHCILENTLDWTKVKLQQEPDLKLITNLSDIINKNLELLDDCINYKKSCIELEIDNTLFFCCNEGHLNAIVRNLISNAIKFSHKGGVIKIRNQQRNEWTQIIIQDQGIGINPGISESLFDYTHNKKQTGTAGEKGAGIGLLIVRDLVKCNQGQISCNSKMNQGTIFTVEFRLQTKNTNETIINH